MHNRLMSMKEKGEESGREGANKGAAGGVDIGCVGANRGGRGIRRVQPKLDTEMTSRENINIRVRGRDRESEVGGNKLLLSSG